MSSDTNAWRPAIAMNPAAISRLAELAKRGQAQPLIDRLARELVSEALRVSGQPASSDAVRRLIFQTLVYYAPQLDGAVYEALVLQCQLTHLTMVTAAASRGGQAQQVIGEIAQLRAELRTLQATLTSAASQPPRPARYHAPADEVRAANRARARRGARHCAAMFAMLIAMSLLAYLVGFVAAGGLDSFWVQVLPNNRWRALAASLPTLALVLDGGFLIGVFGAAAGGLAGVVNNIVSIRGRLELDEHQRYGDYYRRPLRWILRLSQAFAVAKPVISILTIVLVMLSVARIGPAPILAGIAAFCSVLAAGSADTFARMATTVNSELRPLLVYE